MLETIRKGAGSWIVKLLIIAPLILAFAIWGIEDMIRVTPANTVASVGDRDITVDEFRDSYRLQVDQFSRQFGRRLTGEQAQALGVPGQVLSTLVGSAAVDNHAADLGLRMSEAQVVRDVQTDPNFLNSDGSFSQDAFARVLDAAGISENRFVDERRRDNLRGIIISPITESTVVPDALIAITHRFNNEKRRIKWFVLPSDKLEAIPEPDEDALKTFYESRKDQFKTPELRKITILKVTPEAAANAMTVTDEELKARYELNTAAYDTPEERRIEQIAFTSKDDAEAARQAILAGKDFLEAAKQAGASEIDVKLGLMKQADMIDPEIGKAAFALEKDKVSDVIEGGFTTVLLRVTEIKPGITRSFDDVKAQVRDLVVSERLGNEIQRLVDTVDDLRLGGKTPAEIAAELKIPFQEVAAVDRSGNDADGKSVVSGNGAGQLLLTAFDGAVGVENEVVELPGGGYGWVDILGVTPEVQKPFEDVKDAVKSAWRDAETEAGLRKMAQELSDRITKGEAIDAVASGLGAEVKTSEPFLRTEQPEGVAPGAINQAFTLPVGGASSTAAGEGGGRVVFELAEVIAPEPMDEDARKSLRERLQRERGRDVLGEYLTALRADYEVTINQGALNQTLGIGQTGY